VNFIYKHFAFLGPESVYAAVASECAADQGKFWEYHDYLFEHQNGENQGAFTKDKLIGFGEILNLDMTRFEKCVQGDETVARVQADSEEGQKLGVGSTPTFFVNGQPMVGLKSPDQFKAAIEQALSQ
jgi:protein-disulfide isomerase